MVYRAISNDLKERAIWLLDMGWMTDDVCDVLGVSRASIYRWKANLLVHNSVKPPPSPSRGRPRILNADQTHDLFTLLADSPELFLDEIVDWVLITHDTGISRTQVHCLIHDAGLTYKILRRAASERDDVARATWKHYVQTHFISSMIVAVDESSKDDRTIFRKRGRAPRGRRVEIEAEFVRGERYSIVAALTTEGYIGTRIVVGSVDTDEFFDFIVNDILPQMNPFPQDNSVLLLDNCAIHKSDLLREMVEGKGCVLFFLPPYSPDFNPIEESFSAVKAWIRRHWRRMQYSETPGVDLLEACGTVTAEKAKGWFRHSGFIERPNAA